MRVLCQWVPALVSQAAHSNHRVAIAASDQLLLSCALTSVAVMAAGRRINVLNGHLGALEPGDAVNSGLERGLCSAAAGLLENVDAHTMAEFLDDQRQLKAKVFELFQNSPGLLAPSIEGMSKTEHRQLVRDSLRTILKGGYQPLAYFDSDIKKYIYMAEICAPIDLSLVCPLAARSAVVAPSCGCLPSTICSTCCATMLHTE